MSTTNTSEDSTFDSNLTELFLSSVRPKDVYDEIQKVIDISDRIYLTLINKEFEGDTSFPEIKDWVEISCEDFSNDDFEYSFIQYERFTF